MSIDKTPDKAPGKNKLDSSSYGIDLFNTKDTHKLAPLNSKLGGKTLKVDTPFGQASITLNTDGKPAVKTSRSKNAPNADKPTIAAALPSMSLPAAQAMVDPNGISFSLQKMLKQLNMIKSVMNSSSSASKSKTVTKGFSGALSILANNFGYSRVITVFNDTLSYGGIDQIDPAYTQTVKEGLANLIQQAIIFGENNIPKPYIPPVIYGTKYPDPLLVLLFDAIPDLYVQQYYASTLDPYPGYIHWVGPTGDSYYSLRGPTQYPYANSEEDILKTSQMEIALELTPYVDVLGSTLTPSIINSILDNASTNVENNGLEKNLGKNSSSNIMSLLPQLMGVSGTALSLSQSAHLPDSFLNVGKVSAAQQKFAKNIAMAKLMQSHSVGAFDVSSSMSSLGNIAALAGSLGSLGISLPSLSSIAGLATGALSDLTGGATDSIIGALSDATGEIADALDAAGISPSEIAVAALNYSGSTYDSLDTALYRSGVSSEGSFATLSILNRIL